ncbi:MAG: alpha/beta hydrolase [Sphingomonadaceae bacterium]
MRAIGIYLTLLVAALGVTACDAKPNAPSPPKVIATQSTALTLNARDGVTIFGTVTQAPNPKAIILLFHQAGSSQSEYATIAPQLAAAGYTTLAIDQRSGGGDNRTVKARGRSSDYLSATADLQAALDWAADKGKPIILWGSSYSSSLIFLVGAQNQGKVAALMAFSPGEYLGGGRVVKSAAAKISVPIFVTSAKDSGEIAAAAAILAASPSPTKVQFRPAIAGVHGSSTLIPARNAKGAQENWDAVKAFLNRVAP